MAKYTPTGWAMSADGERKFTEMYQKINTIVRARVRKYNLPSVGVDDMMQEGRLAAAYAVDTYNPERGNLDGYISRVVSNALAMVATEALAQARQPYKTVQEPDGSWRKTPVSHVELEHDMAVDDGADVSVEARDFARHRVAQSLSMEQRIDQLKLGSDARTLLQLRLHTPPELWILARNMNRGRLKLEANSICIYIGWTLGAGTDPDRARYQRAARELREQFRYILGIDDVTFEPLKPIIVTDAHSLQTGAKCRNMKELRA